MEDELVSVIIPTCNRQPLLKIAIESVLNQTHKNTEIIIVDANSTDDTQQYLEKIKAEHTNKIKTIHSGKNLNGSQARNIGAMHAQGRWLAFLDDDDICIPNRLTEQLKTALTAPRSEAVTSHYFVKKTSRREKLIKIPKKLTLNQMLTENHLGGASVCFCSKQVFDKIGGFDETLDSSQDHELWVRLYLEGEIKRCPIPTVIYQIHGMSSITKSFKKKYYGRRHFYLKYRHLMNKTTRTTYLATLQWIKIFIKEYNNNWRYFFSSFIPLLKAGYYKYILIAAKYLTSRKHEAK